MKKMKSLAAITMAILMVLSSAGCAANSSKQSDAQPLWQTDNVRNKTVVISDLHLGIDDAYQCVPFPLTLNKAEAIWENAFKLEEGINNSIREHIKQVKANGC